MTSQSLTEAARRAIELADTLARQSKSDEIEPLHLLWALLSEESRASEILVEHGLTRPVLENECQLESFPQEPTLRPQSEPDALPESDAFESALAEARRQVGLVGRHAEIGSEHLLWGLAVVESPAAHILRQHGLHSESLAQHVIDATGYQTEPLEVDFQIDWKQQTATDRTDSLRIIDAAANRAREGLRVVEDFVRFALDDAHLTTRLKNCRHKLAEALRSVGVSELLSARDTRHDVGTEISTPAEKQRESLSDVVLANFKRVQEAARTLEEFGKTLSEPFAEQLGQIRYELYTLEKAVLATESNRNRFEDRRLYLLATAGLCPRGWESTLRQALRAGVGVVQLREKSLSDRQLVDQAHRVREWTRRHGALFVMNDRPDLAVLTEADGVHIGQDELSVREARRIAGPDCLIGVSTHTIQQAQQAVLDGADYLGVGPVFPSQTKTFDQLAGLEFVRQVAAEITLPWFALGGITAGNIDQVLNAGAIRVAVSAAICTADDPETSTRQLLRLIRTASE